MIKSMTGFGRGFAENENYSLTTEIRTINHRFCEINVRLPKQLNFCDYVVKKWISNKIKRGKIEVFVEINEFYSKKSFLKVDKELAIAYHKAILELSRSLDISNRKVKIDQLLELPGIFSLSYNYENENILIELLEKAINESLDNLILMRTTEGEKLFTDILNHLSAITEITKKINSLSNDVVIEQKKKLINRISQILEDVQLDEYRLANEIAYFADKIDINEELIRLFSHIEQFEATLQYLEPVGRKLDFILQEMQREINTIGSKSSNLSISKLVIDGKNEMERIKEQIQNVE